MLSFLLSFFLVCILTAYTALSGIFSGLADQEFGAGGPASSGGRVLDPSATVLQSTFRQQRRACVLACMLASLLVVSGSRLGHPNGRQNVKNKLQRKKEEKSWHTKSLDSLYADRHSLERKSQPVRFSFSVVLPRFSTFGNFLPTVRSAAQHTHIEEHEEWPKM